MKDGYGNRVTPKDGTATLTAGAAVAAADAAVQSIPDFVRKEEENPRGVANKSGQGISSSDEHPSDEEVPFKGKALN